MISSWKIQRYSRCYTRYEDQYSDIDGNPLYSIMASMQGTQMAMSQSAASVASSGIWTALSASDRISLKIDIQVEASNSVGIQVSSQAEDLNEGINRKRIVLVQTTFAVLCL